jgi:hypothetical protein
MMWRAAVEPAFGYIASAAGCIGSVGTVSGQYMGSFDHPFVDSATSFDFEKCTCLFDCTDYRDCTYYITMG